MQPTLLIVWLLLMLPVTAQRNPQQHHHQLLTTMDDYYKFPVCRPGSHLASAEMCELCAEGHTYTEDYNRDNSCQLCKLCGSNEVAVAACTITRNTRCHCAREFYRHASGDCVSRQQNVLNPASGGVLPARRAFLRPTPWSAWSTSDVARTSGDVASATLTSSSDESRNTPAAYFEASSTVDDASSGSPFVTAITPSNTVDDAGTTLLPIVTSQDHADAVSGATTTEKSDVSSAVASVSPSSSADTNGGASSTGETKEDLVTTTVSRSESTDDRKSASTLGTAVEITQGVFHQDITSNTVGLWSTSEATNTGTTTVAHAVITDRMDQPSSTDLMNTTGTWSAIETTNASTTTVTRAMISTTTGPDAHIQGGIVHDDCGVVSVESNHCRPWKMATGVLIVVVVLQMVIIVTLIISGAARRYVLRRNMTPRFTPDSESSEGTPRSSQMSLPEPRQPSDLYPSSEVVSL